MYKKTLLASSIALLAFNLSHATPEFDKAKSQLDTAYNALFSNFAYRGLRSDTNFAQKLANFTAAMRNVEQFVKTNNKGVLFGASSALEQAANTLLSEDTKLKGTLLGIQNQLKQAEGLTPTKATMSFIDLGNLKERVKNAQNILRPKINDYTSTGQKEAWGLLIYALQILHNSATIAHDQLRDGGWLKK